ncbi:MAG: hypothetical protein JJU13_20385, partial [Balneolaceae bacterium]|nr:hypothetical protein [Balneolaceae bacterium]
MVVASSKKVLYLITGALFIFSVLYVFSGKDHGMLVWQDDSVEFSRDIKPILNQNCIVCHGGVKQLGEFSLL